MVSAKELFWSNLLLNKGRASPEDASGDQIKRLRPANEKVQKKAEEGRVATHLRSGEIAGASTGRKPPPVRGAPKRYLAGTFRLLQLRGDEAITV